MSLLLFLLIPFLGCVIAGCMPAYARNREAWFSAAIAVIGVAMTIAHFGHITQGGVIRQEFQWMPEYGLNLVLRMDGLTWLFTLLIQMMCLLVVLYARYYMSPKDPVPRFFSFLLAFMGAMQGVVLSGNLIQLVMFWELTSLTSFLLIGYWHHRSDARRGARMALTVTAAGGLCLLMGVLAIGHVVGSFDVDTVLASGDTLRNHDWYRPILLLVALGAFTKSAQFPFHFWLPHAMAAPTPVSAYLHSATMVKAGIFLLMLLWPVLSGTPEWRWLIGGAGVCTLLIGAFAAMFQHDMKGLLAFSTISHLGLIVLLLGIATPLAMVAAIFHTLNHATFKASLFMAVGIIDHECGTRDMRKLSGLFRVMPHTATLALVASAAMAGVPLLNGFISKEMFFAEALAVGDNSNWWMSAAALAMGVFGVVYSLRFIQVFFGKPATDLPKEPHEAPRWMRVPVEFLVICCLVVGIIPALSIGLILHLAVEAVLGTDTPDYSLALWHGINLPLIMSLVALFGGILLFWILSRYAGLRQRTHTPLMHRLNGREIFEGILIWLADGAGRVERLISTRRLQPQLFLLILSGLLALLLTFRGDWALPETLSPSGMDPWFALLWLAGCSCAVLAAWMAKFHRLTALILIGGTGIATSLTFLWLSAPDLALTQLMVESVTVILLLLGLRWLPPRILSIQAARAEARKARARRSRDMVMAIVGGGVMAAVSYLIMVTPASHTISDFFLLNALPGGGGTNVVNVLLVDFRSLDTLGEITVLSVVALTVYALLRRFRPAPESSVLPPQQTHPADYAIHQTPPEQANTGYLMVPGIYLRALLPIIVVVALYMFMRGHNLPGGGFIAGLVLAIALIAQYILAGTQWVESHLRMKPHRWIGFGLLVATLTGLGSWLFGHPLLTTHTAHVTLPLLGEIHLPSAFIFDVGVLATVLGTTMLILVALAHQSVRGHRYSGDGSGTHHQLHDRELQ